MGGSKRETVADLAASDVGSNRCGGRGNLQQDEHRDRCGRHAEVSRGPEPVRGATGIGQIEDLGLGPAGALAAPAGIP
jgi:hypothetical protein